MTIKHLTGVYPDGYNLSAKYTGLDIQATASVGGTGVYSAHFATIQNDGVINATTAGHAGVSFHAGGIVTNGSATDAAALIEGANGLVQLFGAAITTITNFGTVAGTSSTGAGVRIARVVGVGTLTNGSTADVNALISGFYGIVDYGNSIGISNFGTIIGNFSNGFAIGIDEFRSAGSIVNGSSSNTMALVEGYTGIDDGESNSGLSNFGIITGNDLSGGGVGVHFWQDQGTLFNGTATDTTALIRGYTGVSGGGAIENFGSILGNASSSARGGSGANLYGDSNLANGSAADTTALVQGFTGVHGGGTIENFGSIEGNASSGIGIVGAGYITNGAVNDVSALIEGYRGIYFGGSTTLANFGTITGDITAHGGDALINSEGEALIVNGSSADKTALIEGYRGILASEASTSITNFGTIEGYSGIDLGAEGRATLTNFGTIAGATTQSGGSGIEGSNRTSITNGAITDSGALIEGFIGLDLQTYDEPTMITNFGTIEGAGGVAVEFIRAFGTLNVEAGCLFLGSVLGGGGTLDLASGRGTISGLGGGNVTVSGSMAATTFTDFGTLQIATGARFTLTGPGALATAGTKFLTVDGSLVLTGAMRVGGTAILDDAGLVDQRRVVILNRDARKPRLTIAAGATWALDGDVGFARRASKAPEILIDGLFVKSGGTGVSAVGVMMDDAGAIEVATGTLSFLGKVQGAGLMTIDAEATLRFAAAVTSTLTTSFNGTGGTLALDRAATFAATIAGFANGDTIDLVGAVATGAAVNGADQLVITNGSATVATLQLSGDYAGATFSTAADGQGGTSITVSTAPRPSAAAATLHPFVAAAAGFRAAGGWAAHVTSPAPAEGLHGLLAAPRMQAA